MSRLRALRPLPRALVAAAAAAVVVAGAGAFVVVTHHGRTTPGGAGPVAATGTTTPAPPAVVQLVGLRKGAIGWNKHVVISVVHAQLSSVVVTKADGSLLSGTFSADRTTWTSDATLTPTVHYTAAVTYVDGDHHTATKTLPFAAADSTKHLVATLSPGDSELVGIGSPVVVTFNRSVPASARAVVEQHLAVASTPSVVGAWHWVGDQEVHWRPPTYWKPGTKVHVETTLDHVQLPGGVWGKADHSVTFRIGSAHVSRVSVGRHVMYVYDGGHLVRTFPISAGRDKYPTMGGVHISLEKAQTVTMDSSTVGIPTASPDGYYEKVYWDVRISNGGAFVHAAPWSVGEQGRQNVSHGCVNLSTADAEWFYNFSRRGDVIDVYDTPRPPSSYDPGTSDWNMSWRQWLAGSASPSAAARAVSAPSPRSVEPPEPGSRTSSTTTTTRTSPSPAPRTSTSPTAKPSPTPTHS